MYTPEPTSFICPVCERTCPWDVRTKHHIVPKSRKGKESVLVCGDCHKQIHTLFKDKELERSYSTIEKLRAAPEIETWIAWISKKSFRWPNGEPTA
jgi:hypothetical protein